MTDHWEVFPCQMGEDRAFILYDHGIREEIDELPLPSLLKVRLAFNAPRDDGLPTDQEFDALAALEDALEAEIGKIGGAYVGRITVGGHRYLHYYVDAEEQDLAAIVDRVRQRSGYKIGHLFSSDPEKKGYWEDLFPTKHDWQVIKDQKVLTALEEEGDRLEAVRRIDHWIYFPDWAQREVFKTWAEKAGFSVEGTSESDETSERFCLQIFHDCRPTLEEITHHTITLSDKAEECGGDYDGWETSVERDDAAKPG